MQITTAQLADCVALYKQHELTVAFTYGAFDLLHPGHIALLNGASSLADVLIVAVLEDSLIEDKDVGRPICPLQERMLLVESLSGVDLVVPCGESPPNTLIEIIKPDFLVKGGEYQGMSVDQVAGASAVIANGGKFTPVPLFGVYSTTAIIDTIRATV